MQNPGGRPKKLEELALSISELSGQHVARLQQIAMQGKDKDSIAAIKLLWSYAFGNPTQVITGPDGGPVQTVDVGNLSKEQLEQIREILRAARGG